MNFRHTHSQARRAFIEKSAKTFLGVGTLPLLHSLADAAGLDSSTNAPSSRGRARGGTAKNVIYLYMTGGMSHIDTFDTKPGSETQGPVESIDTSVPGIKVSQYYPRTAHHMDKVAVINSMNSNQGAHAQGQYFMHTSYFLRGTIQHPHMGAWGSYFLGKENKTLPSNVKIGGNSSGLGGGFLESKHAALPIGDPGAGLQHSALPKSVNEDRFQRRLKRVREMNRVFTNRYDLKQVRAYSGMYDEAVKLMKSKDLLAFDLSRETQAIRDAYGGHEFGQGCLLARRLVEHGVRYVEVDYGGWDTHNDNFDKMEEKGAVLDQALASLLNDLSQRGLLNETLVVLATEFGRTPNIIADRNNGRNHYPQAFTCLLAGGGIQGGIKYGATDKEGREVEEDLVTVPDFNATIAFAMGLPLDEEVLSPSRRPFKVADDGTPVKELFL